MVKEKKPVSGSEAELQEILNELKEQKGKPEPTAPETQPVQNEIDKKMAEVGKQEQEARTGMWKFAVALGKLETNPASLTPEQKEFVKGAISKYSKPETYGLSGARGSTEAIKGYYTARRMSQLILESMDKNKPLAGMEKEKYNKVKELASKFAPSGSPFELYDGRRGNLTPQNATEYLKKKGIKY